MTKIWCLENREGAVEDQNNAKISWYQQRYYKIVRAARKIIWKLLPVHHIPRSLRKPLVTANKMRLYAEEKLTERKIQKYTVQYFKETHYLSALLLLYISLMPLMLLIRLNTGYEETLYHTQCTGTVWSWSVNWGGNKITGASRENILCDNQYGTGTWRVHKDCTEEREISSLAKK